MTEVHLDGEVLAEEDAELQDAGTVRALPAAYEEASALTVLRPEVKTAALAAAGGVLAGAATVAAVRAVSAVGSRSRAPRRIGGRGRRQTKVVASRSFLVDVHLLGR